MRTEIRLLTKKLAAAGVENVNAVGHEVRLLYIKIQILIKRLNILEERLWISKPRNKCLVKKIRTLRKGVKVGNTVEKTIINLGIEIRVGIEMVIETRKMIIKTKVELMFHRGTMMLIPKIQG